MDHHKSLYKERTQFLSPRQHNKLNRQQQEAHRNQQRKDRFQDSRNISLSPNPHKPEVALKLCREDKENKDIENQHHPDSTRIVKLVSCTTNPTKLSRQEEFLKRYIEWKEHKKEVKQKQDTINKKKPFLSACSSGRQTTSSSIVPRGHHKEFRPPVGLKNPLDKEKFEENSKPIFKGRQSIYTVVPTPPRKKPTEQKVLNKVPNARNALSTNLRHAVLISNQLQNKTPTAAVRSNGKYTNKNSAQKSTAKLTATNLVISLDKSKATTSATVTKTIERTKLKPRALKMPPPPLPPSSAIIKKPQINKKTNENPTPTSLNQAGAVGKIKRMPPKRAEITKLARKSPLKGGGAHLKKNLKAKMPLNSSKKKNFPLQQVNGKKLLNLVNQNQVADDLMVIQTPKDFANINPFEEFVTSTKLRDTSQTTEHSGGISPIESHSKHGNSSAKRKLLRDSLNPAQIATSSQKLEVLGNVGTKFNFIRYSVANSFLENQQNDNDDKTNENHNATEFQKSEDEENKKIQKSPTNDDKTPTKSGPEERPSNYLSPFVSVTRGKVSLKKEKEKRNSVYLQNPLENGVTVNENHPSDSPKYSVEVRRTLEAVSYFRKQLHDETVRLHQLCEVWELYKGENLEKIQNANGEDMINVTIGQTRLLTSKKFVQFKGLIDRCESGATGINAVAYDGSEDTKPITAVDLEGFWSMLSIQVDNLDKRFDNLNRWKLNDWQDPDEAQPNIKKNLTKVKKAKATKTSKAKPSSALQQMLRNMRKNKTHKNDEANADVTFAASKENPMRRSANNITPRQSIDKKNSPRRLSIIVKDRKYYSPAATVLSMSSSPHRRNAIIQRKSSQDVLTTMPSSMDLRKSALINDSVNTRRMSLNAQSPLVSKNNRKTSLDSPRMVDLRKSALIDGCAGNDQTTPQSSFSSPAPSNARKSILKTPGTAKSRLRNVIFNERLRVKKFNFMVTDDGDQLNADEANNTHEEDLAKSHEDETLTDDAPRTLTLRNRKLRLRPSSEIIIPTKPK